MGSNLTRDTFWRNKSIIGIGTVLKTVRRDERRGKGSSPPSSAYGRVSIMVLQRFAKPFYVKSVVQVRVLFLPHIGES